MIERKRLLSIGYYKKAPSFTGSDGNKCYKIQKLSEEGADDKFQATIWPGPFSSENTPDEKKLSNTAPFTEDGLQELVDWMNSTPIE
ncbi:MAG: GNAT family acetyltransferase [Pseudobutyrivibrio ruminis]|uniref:GNAT family acetyltransferase n=1 Tax=Pseudobutyrivibrio ruminis TaxID=46206 RepID=UPI0026ED2244|nr:GNAT family acetyltransferase [Pseudobutyrivibrio ruminis]MBE5914616.1 GNAT family acetyltransferase [Pseudobutyrivibrio ruminis]